MTSAKTKKSKLKAVAEKRRSFDLSGSGLSHFRHVEEFADGAYKCDHVSPWTKSACNVDAQIMIVGQDWASAEFLGEEDPLLAELGFDPRLPTNTRLQALLDRHFGLSFGQVYATNAFPFVKPGWMQGGVKPVSALRLTVQEFLFPQIAIVDPKLIICLGKPTFDAIGWAIGIPRTRIIADAILHPFKHGSGWVACVAHTGSRGTQNRGSDLVEQDWKKLKRLLNK